MEMRIFKFGGASVQDATGVKNVATILAKEGSSNTVLVVSAMGKMTNAFEAIVAAYVHQTNILSTALSFVTEYHQEIATDLFSDTHQIHKEVTQLFAELTLLTAQKPQNEYNYYYDQIVCYGELLATKIVSAYFTERGIKNQWIDVRTVIRTDGNHRDAKVAWQETTNRIQQVFSNESLQITQGFLGGHENITTTLGREGSDYTAGILAYCLDASSVTIWKDVTGVLNADPRVFEETVLLEKISYNEAIEMAFYGASVIHPKTLQPLEKKRIPLYVRSFVNLENPGTTVEKGLDIQPQVPCFIVKKNQILVSISALDFSFMVENNLGDIFKELHKYQLKVNLIQHSAISFSVCVADPFQHFDAFYAAIKTRYKVRYNKGISLYTIRHFNTEALAKITKKGTALITQTNRETVQLVLKETATKLL